MSDDIETVERVIPAAPEKIFALQADPAKHREFDGSATVRDATSSPGRLVLGSTFGMNMKMGISYSMRSTVVEFEEDRRIAWQSRPAYPIANKLAGGRIWRYELEPVDGGTRVRESWDISDEVWKALVRPARAKTIQNMTATLERLAQHVTA